MHEEEHPELVFALVGACGTDLPLVARTLESELIRMHYQVIHITLSTLIEMAIPALRDESLLEKDDNEFDRIKRLMTAGTALRNKAVHGDAVAKLAVARIREVRPIEANGAPRYAKNAYILKSLKHPNEIKFLREVYGAGCFVVSAYSPRETRVTSLSERLERSQHLPEDKNPRALAEDLIAIDESEQGQKYGQNVKDAFPLGDLFLDARSRTSLEAQLRRFVEIIFRHPYHTPSTDEYGMFHAKAAAMRSSDLNRQVGAAIRSEDLDLIASGCNDTPRAGGGLYWPGDPNDARDFKLGRDASYEQRENMLRQIVARFAEANVINLEGESEQKFVESLLSGSRRGVLKGSQVMGLLEFGRSVHAEMAALMNAARRGVSVKNSTLFCTTFPCHMCARHIVASGIKRLIYIEPYHKSKAKLLHGDAIAIDPMTPVPGKVSFEPFIGIAPRIFMDVFESNENRKLDDGSIIDWHAEAKAPRTRRYLNSYKDIETSTVGSGLDFLDPDVSKGAIISSHPK